MAQVDILFCYFGIRKFATHWVSLGFFCMLVPLSTFTPEVRPDNCGAPTVAPHAHCTMHRFPAAFLLHDISRWHVKAVASVKFTLLGAWHFNSAVKTEMKVHVILCLASGSQAILLLDRCPSRCGRWCTCRWW